MYRSVSFWSSASCRFSSSAETPVPFDFARSSSWAWRRSVRISTRPSSTFLWSCFTRSLRRSSVSIGICSWMSGVGTPYASASSASTSEGVARPVRTDCTSRRSASTAFFIRASVWATTSSSAIPLPRVNERADVLSTHRAHHRVLLAEIEHDDRDLAILGEGRGGRVHHLQPLLEQVAVLEVVILVRARVLPRIAAVHPVDLVLPHED